MNVQPRWWISLIPYTIYNLIIYLTWAAVGADYNDMVSTAGVAFRSLVLPLGIGFLFLAATLVRLGWWRPVMKDAEPAAPKWALWPVVFVMTAMILLNLLATDWSAMALGHLLLLVAAGVLVGFNEEALTRGILVVAMRGSTRSEVRIWLWSTGLFGLMHLPNAIFGIGLAVGAAQTVVAALAGCGFYVLRRLTGTLLVPMVFHGLWDFSLFLHKASAAEIPALRTPIQLATYVIGLVCVIVVLRAWRETALRS